MGAIQFIENMDRTSLTITDEEFEKNVEAAVSAIAEKHRAEEQSQAAAAAAAQRDGSNTQDRLSSHSSGPSSARPSLDMEGPSRNPRRPVSSDDDDSNNEDGALPGLLRTIQKPLSTIGRIFSDEPSSGAGPSTAPPRSPQPEFISTLGRPSPRPSTDGLPPPPMHIRQQQHQQQLSAQEAAARQASAETAEAQRIQRAEHNNVVETLASMFPDLDRDVISDVVYQKEGRLVLHPPLNRVIQFSNIVTRVGLAVDACLALSA